MIKLAVGVKQFNYVSILINKKTTQGHVLVDHQLELGNESLHGEISNNPLYQLADEHHLIEIDESKQRFSFDKFVYLK